MRKAGNFRELGALEAHFLLFPAILLLLDNSVFEQLFYAKNATVLRYGARWRILDTSRFISTRVL
jgi:hypothetical protein